MVRYVDSEGSSDFASIFESVAQAKREEEERRQTELFLQVLDDLEHNHADYRSQRPYGRPRKEYMRVSITDDEIARKENMQEVEELSRKRGKVHTLDDLPKDDFEFLFGGPLSLPEGSDIKVEAGRRLKDGGIDYHVKMPAWLEDIGSIASYLFRLEFLIVFVALVFLIGIFIGKRMSSRKHMQRYTETPKMQLDPSSFSYPPHMRPQLMYAFVHPHPSMANAIPPQMPPSFAVDASMKSKSK